MRQLKSRSGFTLLELLIAVAIFSGLAVLTIAIFARSASSSIRTNISRQRTEAARTIVDRITNDMRYVYLTGEVVNEQGNGGCGGSGGPYFGFDFSDTCLKVLIKYPNTPTDQLVLKSYTIETDGTATLKERRGCSLDTTKTLQCTGGSDNRGALLSESYKIETLNPAFTGEDATAADRNNRVPFLRIKLTVKPADLTGNCSANKSLCYTISTTITAGKIQ